jgi:hypothetical protein
LQHRSRSEACRFEDRGVGVDRGELVPLFRRLPRSRTSHSHRMGTVITAGDDGEIRELRDGQGAVAPATANEPTMISHDVLGLHD